MIEICYVPLYNLGYMFESIIRGCEQRLLCLNLKSESCVWFKY